MRLKVGDSSWLDIRLEDLASNPQAIQGELECFLGIKSDLCFLDAMKSKLDPERAIKFRWKDGRTPGEIDNISRQMGQMLKRYGYT
jgi:hypothetical protein